MIDEDSLGNAALDTPMRIETHFDAGAVPAYEISAEQICFDLRVPGGLLNALIRNPSNPLRVELLVDEREETFLLHQGLIVSTDADAYQVIAFEQIAAGHLVAIVELETDCVQMASRYPYGRDHVDALICETAGCADLSWQFLKRGFRSFPMAQFGVDDGQCPIHYIFAGEDPWETAGSWAADQMLRCIVADAGLREALLGRCVLRIIPLVGLYGGSSAVRSYCTTDGVAIYGASTWASASSPPEFVLLRDLVEETLHARRLGYVMSIHSWQAMRDHSCLETIQSSGDYHLPPERMQWAEGILQQMIKNVPDGKTAFPEKIWHPGLARDYLLGRHQVISFRVEVGTAHSNLDKLRQAGKAFIYNLSEISDFSGVYP